MSEIVDKPLKERELTGLLFLLTLALALRIVWVGLVPNEQVADFKMYDDMAASFYRGVGYLDAQARPSAFKPPGYPLLLALMYHVFGESQFAAKVVQANLSTLLCLLVFLLTRRLFGDRQAFIALVLAAFHPTFIYSVTLLGTEIPFTCLTTCAILILILRPPGAAIPSRDLALAGLAFGLAGLMRPMALLSPAALVLWLLWDWRGLEDSLRMLCCFCLALAIPIFPWTVRNYVHFQRLVPISTNGGFNLFYGHNPMGEVVWIPYSQLKSLPDFPADEQWQGMSEPERSSYMQTRAKEYIRLDPAGVFRRMPLKFYMLMLSPDVPSLYWNIEGLPAERKFGPKTLTILASLNRIFAYAILCFAFIGLCGTGLRDPRLVLVYGLTGVWIAFHLIYWGKPRFRFPFLPFLILLAAGPMARLSAKLRSFSHSRGVPQFQPSNRPPHEPSEA